MDWIKSAWSDQSGLVEGNEPDELYLLPNVIKYLITNLWSIQDRSVKGEHLTVVFRTFILQLHLCVDLIFRY